MEVALVLVASVLLQFTAAFFALRLIQVAGKHISGTLITVATCSLGDCHTRSTISAQTVHFW